MGPCSFVADLVEGGGVGGEIGVLDLAVEVEDWCLKDFRKSILAATVEASAIAAARVEADRQEYAAARRGQ